MEIGFLPNDRSDFPKPPPRKIPFFSAPFAMPEALAYEKKAISHGQTRVWTLSTASQHT
jgi:hypothetical protein